jgi:hypothetical protein
MDCGNAAPLMEGPRYFNVALSYSFMSNRDAAEFCLKKQSRSLYRRRRGAPGLRLDEAVAILLGENADKKPTFAPFTQLAEIPLAVPLTARDSQRPANPLLSRWKPPDSVRATVMGVSPFAAFRSLDICAVRNQVNTNSCREGS